MLNLRRVLAASILLAVAALGIMLWRHLQQQSPEELLKALPKQVDLSLEELHYTQNEAGKRSWTLDADKAEYQRDNSRALLDAVHLTLFEAGRFGDIQLQAQHGLLKQEERQVEVWDQVRVSSARGEQLLTERLHYDDQQRRLTTDEPIRFSSPRMELTGTGMQIDIDTGRLLVKNDVWMLLLPAEKERAGHE